MAADIVPPAVDHASGGPLNASISNAVVALYRDYFGRGPTKTRTTIDHDVVLIVLRDSLTKAERSLVARDETDEVLRIRAKFQATMEDDIVKTVTELTGRPVIAFMSANSVDPDIAAELLVLEPLPEV